jgi:hypothetical protein
MGIRGGKRKGCADMNKPKGGPGRGQGRKPVKQGEETVTISLRVTVAQRQKLACLGGAEWVRCKIDREKEPKVGVTIAETREFLRP